MQKLAINRQGYGEAGLCPVRARTEVAVSAAAVYVRALGAKRGRGGACGMAKGKGLSVKKTPRAKSEGEETLMLHIRADKLPLPVRECVFAHGRKWRFDMAWIDRKLAVEIEGGVWSGGRHTRGSGYVKDMEKYNTAAMLGWRVLRFSTEQVRDGSAIATVKEALK